MGLGMPSLSVLLLSFSPPAERGVNSAALQIVRRRWPARCASGWPASLVAARARGRRLLPARRRAAALLPVGVASPCAAPPLGALPRRPRGWSPAPGRRRAPVAGGGRGWPPARPRLRWRGDGLPGPRGDDADAARGGRGRRRRAARRRATPRPCTRPAGRPAGVVEESRERVAAALGARPSRCSSPAAAPRATTSRSRASSGPAGPPTRAAAGSLASAVEHHAVARHASSGWPGTRAPRSPGCRSTGTAGSHPDALRRRARRRRPDGRAGHA